jgi:hypothetical protein
MVRVVQGADSRGVFVDVVGIRSLMDNMKYCSWQSAASITVAELLPGTTLLVRISPARR